MGKQTWKAGNMLNPVPAVMVSCQDKKGNTNIITVAWAGTICTNPPMLYISVRPERFSYNMIKEQMEFTVNLTTAAMAKAVDWCGVRSGADYDKWKETGLTQGRHHGRRKLKAILKQPGRRDDGMPLVWGVGRSPIPPPVKDGSEALRRKLLQPPPPAQDVGRVVVPQLAAQCDVHYASPSNTASREA